jgi:hypothetical protein
MEVFYDKQFFIGIDVENSLSETLVGYQVQIISKFPYVFLENIRP